ncbi:hypothetical protein [Sporomusa malonica]|uniref:Uncharacterized protein n=1 Tax=Sporomusa malonica TaxID=112901 RepID=A0A1W2F2X0_9FIRM|nr:hypothetical protein [Sporomusa malonica]SMD16285.1 hypothetical protein SAMN04488500_14113 [Sporomusa malonica]
MLLEGFGQSRVVQENIVNQLIEAGVLKKNATAGGVGPTEKMGDSQSGR